MSNFNFIINIDIKNVLRDILLQVVGVLKPLGNLI